MNRKILLIFIFGILLVGTINAYEYTTTEGDEKGLTKVDFEYDGRVYDYWFNSYEDKKGEFNNSKKDYNSWIDSEMTKYLNDLIPDITANPKITNTSIQTETFEGEEPDNWFVSWVKWILGIFRSDIDDLEAENTLMKNELCKKDNTYSWCIAVIKP